MLQSRLIRAVLLSLLLMAIAALAHFPLIRGGLDALNADYAPVWTFADELRTGKLSAFVFNMHYAGVVLTCARAAWLGLFAAFVPEPDALWTGNLVFSYALVPGLMALAAFWCARGYANRTAAWVVGLMVAIGFPSFDGHLNNDVYSANFIFGVWVLGLRARIRNPWSSELSPMRFWFAAVLTGLMIYNSRVCLIPALVLWMPPLSVVRTEIEALRPKSRFARILMVSAGWLVGLFLYLEVFGADLGMFFGRRVKIHGTPNLKIALVLAGWVWLAQGGVRKLGPYWEKLALFGFGVTVGFAPELIHRLLWSGPVPEGTEQTRSISEGVAVLGQVPSSFHEIVAVAGSGWGLFSVLLWLVPIGFVCDEFLRKKNVRWESAFVCLVLCIAAFCRVRNYAGVTSRYLFPLVPVLVAGASAMVSWTLSQRRFWLIAGWAGVAIHSADLVWNRREFTRAVVQTGFWAKTREIADTFKAVGVPVVATDDYWRSNELSVASRMDPVFFVATPVPGLIHPSAPLLMKSSLTAGFLLRSELAPNSEYSAQNVLWELTPLKKLDGRFLYLGHRKSSLPAPRGAGG